MTAAPGSGQRPGQPITADAVRELLSDPKLFAGLPPGLDDDAEIALDSLGLVWFLHQVELRYGLVIEPQEEFFADFTSVRRITAYLTAYLADAGGPGGRP
ncbi:acyl carrier protein [Actinacidiphila sp. DG2A-62]|jgi:acyl carrier protein|uniref:acyl carrier protein n=1 Tax=Actinacidiphila sp. DG2A-62 TaxID=3108821 RepID=UPI002DB91498|nr:acyl carrier protein [Actinacidiphila sp. DG2A-62]MEC3992661.1 acyl carrier protein [Actinacidiphila sp. DG2A-62]